MLAGKGTKAFFERFYKTLTSLGIVMFGLNFLSVTSDLNCKKKRETDGLMGGVF